MRTFTLTLGLLLALIQYPLWFGKGGWLRVWELDSQLHAQKQVNARLEQRNAWFESEVKDLRQGLDAIEERARYELGMVRPDEVFVQITPSAGSTEPTLHRMPGADAAESRTTVASRL
jgi:cell division protein FtsB